MLEKSNVPYDTISQQSVSTQSMFNKCCICFSLRTGCFILGYLSLVINIFQTLGIVALTTFIGLTTHGFDHLDPERPPADYPEISSTDMPDVEGLDRPLLTQISLFLLVILFANACWLIINVACLFGLHQKCPGPIRVFIGFACARLMLAFAGFIYLVMTNKAQLHIIVTHSIDLGLTAYFILVYYIYAVQLEREHEAEIAQPAAVNSVFIYPTKLDKSHLVA